MDDQLSGMDWLPAREAIGLLRDLGITDLSRYFNCIMLGQGSIDDEIRELLVRTAVILVCLKQRRQHIKTEWCEGEVVTAFNSASIESISGIKFECTLDIESQTTKATFIVTHALLEQFDQAKWLRDELEDIDLKTSVFN